MKDIGDLPSRVDFKGRKGNRKGRQYSVYKKTLYHAIEINELNKKKEHFWEVPT